MAVIGLLSGIVMIGGTISSLRDDKAFAQSAETTLAEPVSDAVPGTPYQGDLVYQSKDGRSVQIPSAHVPLAVRDRIGALKTVEIAYLPEDTDKVRFALWPVEPANKKHLLIGAVLLGLGLAFFFFGKQRK